MHSIKNLTFLFSTTLQTFFLLRILNNHLVSRALIAINVLCINTMFLFLIKKDSIAIIILTIILANKIFF